MLSQAIGKVAIVDKQRITFFVGALGFDLQVPDATIFDIKKETPLFVHMHWNAEQGPSLFGFATELEKTVFSLIISCSGVGPKIGLAVLGDIGAQNFLHAIEMSDDRMLSKVNGIGTKKAEQIIFQLKNKVAQLMKSGIKIEGAQSMGHWHTVSQALESLNYSRTEIARAMNHLKESKENASVSFDKLMRQALSFLSK